MKTGVSRTVLEVKSASGPLRFSPEPASETPFRAHWFGCEPASRDAGLGENVYVGRIVRGADRCLQKRGVGFIEKDGESESVLEGLHE